MQDTFTRPDAIPKLGQTQSRNLLGFKDGTANPDADDEALMNTLVWTSTADTAPTAQAASRPGPSAGRTRWSG